MYYKNKLVSHFGVYGKPGMPNNPDSWNRFVFAIGVTCQHYHATDSEDIDSIAELTK